MRKEYVTFVSPGTFMPETTSKPIPGRDVQLAIDMAADVSERYGAKPFCFYFTTVLASEPVPDGEGGFLDVAEKEVGRSGMHYLGGQLLTLDEVEERKDPAELIMIANMRSNCPVVVVNTNSYRSTTAFNEEDVLLNVDPNPLARKARPVLRRGDEPELVEYRRRKTREYQERLGLTSD